MMDGYEKILTCPNCHGQRLPFFRAFSTSPYFSTSFEGVPLTVSTISNYVRCDDCGLFFQSPRLTDENVAKYYASGLYSESLGISEERISEDELRRANVLMDFLEKVNISFKSHLDIGAARGHFLNLTHEKYNAESYGVDLHGKYEGNPMKHAELLSSIHCLEHCIDPNREINKYKKYCDKYLLLEVPSAADGSFRFPHLYVFPKSIIVSMVKNAGFKVITVEDKTNTRILAEVN